MRNLRERRPATIDIDHIRQLHQEAIDQLELLRTALDAVQNSNGAMRDSLLVMAANNWSSYMDVMHMNENQSRK